MAKPGRIEVRGYRELVRAFNEADRTTKRELREALRDIGRKVRDDAAKKLVRASSISVGALEASAATLRVVVRQRGVSIEQARRKVDGMHPDYGATQMKYALVPAAAEDEAETEQELRGFLDRVVRTF